MYLHLQRCYYVTVGQTLDRRQNEVNEFLDDLRESGETNMFGAGPHVMEEFMVDRREAKAFVMEWMRTFEARHRRVCARCGGGLPVGSKNVDVCPLGHGCGHPNLEGA